jgi:tripartite-type tricarboxylate transporter receptor subunit TctC
MNHPKKAALRACIFGLLMAAACAIAHAQVYPAKAIRMVVPFPPGGATDNLARVITPRFSALLGQPVVIDNKGGANTIVGADNVAKSPRDGYTLLLTIDSTLSINPWLYPKLPYDPAKDFSAITVIATVPQVLVVHPSVPTNTLKELLALARSKPGTLNYASYGAGSPPQLLTELLKSSTQTDFVHIPYKGGAPATADLLAGQVQMLIGSVPTNLPHIKAGRLRALGVTGQHRFPALPDVPTISETVPGYDVAVLFGLLAPAGTPKAIVDKLNSAMAATLKDPEVAQRLKEQAFEPVGSSPEEFTRIVSRDSARWSELIRKLDIKGE